MEFGRFPDKSTQSIDHAGPDWQGTFTSLVLRQIPTAADTRLNAASLAGIALLVAAAWVMTRYRKKVEAQFQPREKGVI